VHCCVAGQGLTMRCRHSGLLQLLLHWPHAWHGLLSFSICTSLPTFGLICAGGLLALWAAAVASMQSPSLIWVRVGMQLGGLHVAAYCGGCTMCLTRGVCNCCLAAGA
jgi:hypothetical protein